MRRGEKRKPKKPTGHFYFKLECGHIRMINADKIDITYNETVVYCRKCDIFPLVVSKAGRDWNLGEVY